MDEIVFYPPTQFGIECDPKTSCIFEEYALAHAMSLNVTYMSRDMSRTADQKTYAHFEKRKEGEKFTHTLYIFLIFQIYHRLRRRTCSIIRWTAM